MIKDQKKVIFWRTVPIDVGKGDFYEFLKLWEGRVVVVSHVGLPEERKHCGYSDIESSNVEYVVLKDYSCEDEKARQIIDDNFNEIHIFNGIRGKNQDYLNYLIKACKEKGERPLIGVAGERPNFIGGAVYKIIRKIGYRLLYGHLAKKYNKNIRCFFAMGKLGVETYKKYGFSEESLFQYMYCPKLEPIETNDTSDTNDVKFLYVGRFNYSTKGLDVLMNAFDKLSIKSGWKLDLVGGYGQKKDEVIEWSKRRQNVDFLGAWTSDAVCANMQDYDVCIVPSRYDGWNLIPNQAIHAGVATIISDEAVSDELIGYSGAGIVVKSGSVKELTLAIDTVVNNKVILKDFKERTKAYRDKISAKTVGKYFYDALRYSFFNEGREKPRCPWSE